MIPEVSRTPVLRVVAYLAGVAGLAFSITVLWYGMRAVLDVGGFCASGGPYEIDVVCPDAVIATTPLSILGGFLAVGLMIWGGSALGGSWVGLAFLAWPALFISLGWNFLQYGLFPPGGGWVWTWLLCGVLFVLMGAIPLVIAIGAMQDGPDGDGRAYASGRVVVRPRPRPPVVTEPMPMGGPVAAATAPAGPSANDPLVDRLERLADLRRRGDLTNAEYETAKAATLAEASTAAGTEPDTDDVP
jgi:hypothetical protein